MTRQAGGGPIEAVREAARQALPAPAAPPTNQPTQPARTASPAPHSHPLAGEGAPLACRCIP
jgi:hypothetical protein